MPCGGCLSSPHRLVLTATDRGSPPLVGSATLTVVVMDVNDNSPTIPAPPWEVRVPESECRGGRGGGEEGQAVLLLLRAWGASP